MDVLLKKITVPVRTVPFALLVLCLVSFGLLVPWLGFYWDDWPVILITRLQGIEGFRNFYQYDRPFSAWTYILSTPLLGTHAASWHMFSLLLRWLTVLGMWWSLRLLWPRRLREVTWMAFLFAVYPIFDQQAISVAYSQHWISYALYFVSLASMLRSLCTSYSKPGWTILSLSTAALHLFTMEYFLGLELLRPIFIIVVISERVKGARHQLIRVIKHWSPYLVLLLAFSVWRLFFIELAGEDPNQPELLSSLFTQPLPALVHAFQIVLKDVVFFLTGAWYRTLPPTQIDLLEPSFLLSLVLSTLVAGALSVYLLRLKVDQGINIFTQRPWIRQAIMVGLIAMLLGPLPSWVSGRQAIVGLYGSRFGLGAMFGASVLFIGILEWFTSRNVQKIILLGTLIGLAVGFHFRTANDFRWISIDQNRFYWQMYWRAPYLKPDTAVLSDGELFPYVGTYSTAAALNLLYPQPEDSPDLAYWFFDLDRDFGPIELSRLDRNIEIDTQFRSLSFASSSQNSVVINYQSEEGHCLQVLRPSDVGSRDVSDRTREALPVSNLNRIEAVAPLQDYPPADIFGEEPQHTWCYYYQKADLARHRGDWSTVIELGDRVQQLGYAPNNPKEWWPFIQAYAHMEQWQKAQSLTLRVFSNDESLRPNLCNLWDQFEARNENYPEVSPSLKLIEDRLQCLS